MRYNHFSAREEKRKNLAHECYVHRAPCALFLSARGIDSGIARRLEINLCSSLAGTQHNHTPPHTDTHLSKHSIF